jgi:hypothetical protein
MKIKQNILNTIIFLLILTINIIISPAAAAIDASVKTYPISGKEWTTTMGSTKACNDYCIGAGFPSGNVTAFGSKTCSGESCSYISDFKTGAITSIYYNVNCGCNSQITCSCNIPPAAKKPDLVIDSIRIEPANPTNADQICIYATIKNIGTANVVSSDLTAWTYVNNFHISNMYYGRVLYIGDKIEKQVLCSKYGENVQFKFDKNSVRIVIDPSEVNIIDELNESNNEKNSDFSIVNPQNTDWDISIKFDQANIGPFYPFSSTTGLEGLSYQEKLNETDNLYEDVPFNDTCPSYWQKYPEQRRAKGWYAERKKISDDEYRILIRGIAPADCGNPGPGYAQGEFSINPHGSWNIDQVIRCNVNSSNKEQETYCTNNGLSVKFAAGSMCGGSCACADSGSLDIELILKNTGIENRKILIPATIKPIVESPEIQNPTNKKPVLDDPITNPKNKTTEPDKNDINKNTAADDKPSVSPLTNNIIFFVFFLLVILVGYLLISTARKIDAKNEELDKAKICLKCGKKTESIQTKCPNCGSENFSVQQ